MSNTFLIFVWHFFLLTKHFNVDSWDECLILPFHIWSWMLTNTKQHLILITYKPTLTFDHGHIHTCVHTYIHTYIHTCIHTYSEESKLTGLRNTSFNHDVLNPVWGSSSGIQWEEVNHNHLNTKRSLGGATERRTSPRTYNKWCNWEMTLELNWHNVHQRSKGWVLYGTPLSLELNNC